MNHVADGSRTLIGYTLRFDGGDPMWFSAKDLNMQDYWIINNWTRDARRLPDLFKESGGLKMQVRTDQSNGTVVEFPLAGFTTVWNQALAHVSGR